MKMMHGLVMLLTALMFACGSQQSPMSSGNTPLGAEDAQSKELVERVRAAKQASPAAKYYAIMNVTLEDYSVPIKGLRASLACVDKNRKIMSSTGLSDENGVVILAVMTDFTRVPNFMDTDVTGDYLFTITDPADNNRELVSAVMRVKAGTEGNNHFIDLGPSPQQCSDWRLAGPLAAYSVFSSDGNLAGIRLEWNPLGARSDMRLEVAIAIQGFDHALNMRRAIVSPITGSWFYATTTPGRYGFVFLTAQPDKSQPGICIITAATKALEAKRALFADPEMQMVIGAELIREFGAPDFTKIGEIAEFSNIDLSKMIDFTGVENLKRLKRLVLWSTELSDWSFLADLQNLEHLDLYHSNIKDVSMLSNLPLLHTVYLGATGVTDLMPLATLPKLERVYVPNRDIDYSFLKEKGVAILF